jgi:hypothetical protein
MDIATAVEDRGAFDVTPLTVILIKNTPYP